jgi:hypothetical protein
MNLMFNEEHLVNHKGIFYVLDGITRMKRMKDMKIIYHGYEISSHCVFIIR